MTTLEQNRKQPETIVKRIERGAALFQVGSRQAMEGLADLRCEQADGAGFLMIGNWSKSVLLVMAAATSLGLAGCNKQRREKEAAAFGQSCGQAGFSPKQCTFLYVMRRDAQDRADESDAIALVGLSAANVAAINARR